MKKKSKFDPHEVKTSSLNDIKKELHELSPKQLVELCLSLAKYKKDNKEYLGYLIFESHDKNTFVASVKSEVDILFSQIEIDANLYYAKKSLRKILRQIVKYCKYVDDKALAAELHIYFCHKLKFSGIAFKRSQLIINMYEQELRKINALIASLHEDLQNDYLNDLESIAL